MSDNKFVIDASFKDENLNVKACEDLFYGFEFEFNARNTRNQDIARHFKVKSGKNYGKETKTVTKSFRTSSDEAPVTIKMPIECDKYKETEYVAQVYVDGSVQHEIVTRPVRMGEMGCLKTQVWDYINGLDEVDLEASGKAGLHITVLTNQHQELSSWNRTHVQNIIQYTRAYFGEFAGLLAPHNLRNVYYCQVNPMSDTNAVSTMNRYSAINVRRDMDGRIWGLEFRMPSGTHDWNQVIKYVRTIAALIRFTARLSKLGRVNFTQEQWNEQVNYAQVHNTQPVIRMTHLTPRARELLNILSDDLEFYGVNLNPETQPEPVDERIPVIIALKARGFTVSEIVEDFKSRGEVIGSRKISELLKTAVI